jgi:hypothetical protein
MNKIINVFGLLFLVASCGYSQKINLVKDQLLPLSHFEISSNYGKLVDGVAHIDSTYAPTENSSPISWSHKILIDLRGTYNITQLKMFDGYGTPTINWYAGTTPFNLTLIAGPITMNGFGSYKSLIVSANNVKYLVIEQVESLTRFPSEIEVYGTRISSDPIVIPTQKPLIDVKQLLGSNGFFWEDPNNVGIFTNYRLFSEMQWFFYDGKKLMVSPSSSGGVHMKNQLNSFKSKGTESVVVLQKSPNYIMNKSATEHDGQYKPIDSSITDYGNPTNWLEISQAYYRIAGYLGSTQIPNSDMNFHTMPQWPGQVVNVAESGMNLANWMEVLNEPDKNWGTPVAAAYFSPYTLASLMSAAYDGHQGTMPKAGIKTADPNMKVAMGGLYKLQYEYIKAMHEWAKANRTDGKFPADAINFHHYNNNDNTGGQGSGTSSVHPEAGQLITQLQQVVDYRNKYLPDVEIWLSEWGMSTNMGNLKVPTLASYGTREDVQGAWMIRTYLTLMKMNIDKSYMYATEDEKDLQGNSLFGGVGILKYGSLAKKRSYYYVTSFVDLFKNSNYKFKEDRSTSTVRDYVFEDLAQGKEMRFVWSPTGSNVSIPNYNVNITGSAITGFRFKGETSLPESYPNNNLVTVTEIPMVFIYNTEVVGVDPSDESFYDLIIYPNPSSNKVYLNMPAKEISIFSLDGVQQGSFILNEQSPELDLSSYPLGVYILKVTGTDYKVVNLKLTKK